MTPLTSQATPSRSPSRRQALLALCAGVLLAPSSAPAEERAVPLAFESGAERLEFTSGDIWAVEAFPGQTRGAVTLEITLNGDARDRFARFTTVHLGQPASIFVGGEFLVAPVLQAPITSGRMAIGFPDQPTAAAAMDLLLGRAVR